MLLAAGHVILWICYRTPRFRSLPNVRGGQSAEHPLRPRYRRRRRRKEIIPESDTHTHTRLSRRIGL
jgi:transposase